jgi:hypothetical protein
MPAVTISRAFGRGLANPTNLTLQPSYDHLCSLAPVSVPVMFAAAASAIPVEPNSDSRVESMRMLAVAKCRLRAILRSEI